MYVLVDCNNFYVSCERLFNPKLAGQPVIVLSNNDGCAVARSNEAKALGIGMGDPYFKIRDLCEVHRVAVFSSNYQLYGDISQRIMSLLKEACPDVEIYSIDEAFMYFPSGVKEEECTALRSKILRWVGIPVSMGIAPTKTLAKAANRMAKKSTATGVFSLCSPEKQEEVLRCFPIGDIWGISKGFESRLHRMGIRSAWQLREADLQKIRKEMGVIGERMVRELRGESCLHLEMVQPKKSIMCSRSFSETLTDLAPIEEALSTHVSSACAKMRAQSSCAQALCIYLIAIIEKGTNRRETLSCTVPLAAASSDTGHLITAAKLGLRQLYRKGNLYKKVGVLCLNLIDARAVPMDLFEPVEDPRRSALWAVVDAVNEEHGKRTLFSAAAGVGQRWRMRSEKRSGRYTTSWDELRIVI